MNDAPREFPAPLAELGGAVPPAPDWFVRALADAPERRFVEVGGAAIETLSWGRRGDPGLLLMHGNGASADWYAFLGPMLAEGRRVTAFSWSGMGRSAHRPHYTLEAFVAELFAVAEAEGLFDAGKPVVMGHSFGGYLMMAAVQAAGERLGGAIINDTPFLNFDTDGPPKRMREGKPNRIYPTLVEALGRFRLAPPQPCANLYIADYIARAALHETEAGWTWRFDPRIFRDLSLGESSHLLDNPKCPLALIWGEHSWLMPPERVARIRQRLPAGSPAIAIPDAEHHVMIDQPLALVAALRGLLAAWPQQGG